MKKAAILILTMALGAAAAGAQTTELSRDRDRLVDEIVAALPSPGPASRESRLIDALETLSSGAAKSAVRPSGGAGFRLIDAVWALGETGGPAAERALLSAAPQADPTVRLNIDAALAKIAGRPAAGGRAEEPAAAHLEPGDILFRKGYFGLLNPAIGAQAAGHVGVYAGVENGEHMVIEGWLPVRKVSLKVFIGNWPYYGNRTTPVRPTAAQRAAIVDYVRAQLGKGYDMAHTGQKGPGKFDCVGLAEAAYEAAGLNPTPDEFESGWGWPLTPTEQYEHTLPNH